MKHVFLCCPTTEKDLRAAAMDVAAGLKERRRRELTAEPETLYFRVGC